MAKQMMTTVTDDLDGSSGAQQVTFAFQGVAYSIDLGDKNVDKLAKALAPYIEHATRLRGATKSPTKRAERSYDIVQLREWAGKKKIALPQRGRIPTAIIEKYQAAGGR